MLRLKGNFSEKFLFFFIANLKSNSLKVCIECFVKIRKRCLCKKNALENSRSLTAAAIFEFASVKGCGNCVTYVCLNMGKHYVVAGYSDSHKDGVTSFKFPIARKGPPKETHFQWLSTLSECCH